LGPFGRWEKDFFEALLGLLVWIGGIIFPTSQEKEDFWIKAFSLNGPIRKIFFLNSRGKEGTRLCSWVKNWEKGKVLVGKNFGDWGS